MRQVFLRESRSEQRHTLKNKIQLKNTRGDNQIQNWNQDFDYLLLVQTDPPFIASVVPWEVVDQHSHVPDKGDQVKIENWLPEMGDLELLDMNGSLLKVYQQSEGNTLRLNLSPGMYLLRSKGSFQSQYLIIH